MTILDRYIVRSILGFVFLITAVFLMLDLLFVFIDQQDEIGTGHYTAIEALWFTLLNLPQQAFELLPITVLIGSLVGLGSLARGSELIVMRTTGMSIMRLAGAVLIAGVTLIGIEVLLGEVLAPPLQTLAREQKAFDKYTDISFSGGGGDWVRDGNLILNIARQSGQRQFRGMQIFQLSPDHHLVALGHAANATVGADKKWLLGDYIESAFTDDSVVAKPAGPRILQSNITAGFLGLAAQDPNQMTNRSLWQLIQYSHANSLDTSRYVFAFWSRIARTLAIAFAVLLGIPFVLGSLRSAGAGTRMFLGVMLGISFFLLQKLIESGTIVFGLNPMVLAWIPTAAMGLATLLLMARAR